MITAAGYSRFLTSRKPDIMDFFQLRRLFVELQCLGVTLPDGHTGRSGGAGPAEGRTVIIQGRHLNVPTESWYIFFSPYSIEHSGDSWLLYKNKIQLCAVTFPQEPGFYNQTTSAGLPLRQLGLLHGSDCFASTVHQDCLYWNTPQQCRFCGIGLSLQNNSTVLIKEPFDLGSAAACASELDSARHATLTTGVWNDESRGLEHLADCIREIKKRTDMPVHVQVQPPRALKALDLLKSAGADTLGIHVEVGDIRLLADLAPGKAHLGLKAYNDCWKYAVSVFGHNQVSSFLIAGLGETREDFIAMVEHIAALGVFPYVLPLRPIPGTLLERLRPPKPSYMEGIYTDTALILTKYGLASSKSKAGCVRCGACSCLQLYENEPSR